MAPERNPFISVIIPTYNRLELLKQTVDSVRAQTFRDFELIVVDDGSTDGTGAWLEGQSDLKPIYQANRGIASSRNAGAAIARGEWLALLDHDDLWARDKLEIQARFVQQEPHVALVAARHVRLGAKVAKTRRGNWIEGDLFVKAFAESFIHTSSVIIRRDVFGQIGGFPTQYRFADEFDVWLKIAARYPIAYVDDPLVFIRFYEANTSHDRIGVRTDTFDILTKNYDPARIPRNVYRKTMSDHDISFGRAYLGAGELPEALKWFRRSIERTPWRLRSWRYYLRYRIVAALRGNPNNAPSHIDIAPGALEFLVLDRKGMLGFCEAALEEHQRLVQHHGAGLMKNAPETAVTVVSPPGLPSICVKEFRWRGWLHAFKGLFRATQGMRAFRNGPRLGEAGIGVPRALALIRKTTLGLVRSEWILMEAVSGALELDRYILSRIDNGWNAEERKRLTWGLARLIGTMHARGIFHSDLKTCNILVAPESETNRERSLLQKSHDVDAPHTEANTGTNDSEPTFLLLDFDDVSFRRALSDRQRIKNLTQIFLSTPIAIGAADRLRFMREYGRSSGLDLAQARRIARQVLEAARGRQILYVGFHGDVVEKWD
ncbi:MAG: glycosyltransferase [Thermodesulfobacteriota bacterium]